MTERPDRPAVALRPLDDDDRQRLLAWRNAPEVAEFMFGDHVIEQAEHDRWFAAARRDDGHRHRIVVAGGEPVGLVALTRIHPAWRSAEWGGYIADPAGRGRGIGRRAIELSLQLAFGELGLHRVWVEAFADNDRAIALYESVGFRREARFRDKVWKAGAPRDVVGLAILATDRAEGSTS